MGGIICRLTHNDRRFAFLRQQRAERIKQGQMLRL
jgi:hypothetical protein